MKSVTFDHVVTGSGQSEVSVANPISVAFRDFVAGVREAWAQRQMRSELATLDDSVLRDIGIASDEIPRVIAKEQFTPRAWQ